MSVTTSKVFNADQLQAALPQGATVTADTPRTFFTTATPKTLTAAGATDQQLQAAIDTAATAFVDEQANSDALLAKATAALANNQTFLGLGSPTNAQVLAQVQALTRQMNALIRLAANQLTSTAGT